MTSMHPRSGERGFTLLLASLVSSVVLTLGISIFQIAYKQVILSSTGRDSQFAFYAADTGAECALYWDFRHDYFGTTTPPGDALCAEQVLLMSGRSDTLPYTIVYQFEANGYCADVSVRKSGSDPHTIVHADGYSTTCADLPANPRALQRSVEIRY